MIINPITIRMPRHELEAVLAASSARLKALKGDTHARRILEGAVDRLADQIGAETGQRGPTVFVEGA